MGECESSQRPLSCSPSLYLAHQSQRTPWSTRGGGLLGAPKPWNALGSESGGCFSTTSTWRRQFVVFLEKSKTWGLIEWGGAAAMGNGTSKKNKGAIFIRYDNKVCWYSDLELDWCQWHWWCRCIRLSLIEAQNDAQNAQNDAQKMMQKMMQVHKVEFDRGTNARDLQEQLAVVAGYNRWTFCIIFFLHFFFISAQISFKIRASYPWVPKVAWNVI